MHFASTHKTRSPLHRRSISSISQQFFSSGTVHPNKAPWGLVRVNCYRFFTSSSIWYRFVPWTSVVSIYVRSPAWTGIQSGPLVFHPCLIDGGLSENLPSWIKEGPKGSAGGQSRCSKFMLASTAWVFVCSGIKYGTPKGQDKANQSGSSSGDKDGNLRQEVCGGTRLLGQKMLAACPVFNSAVLRNNIRISTTRLTQEVHD